MDFLLRLGKALGTMWFLVTVALPVVIYHEHGPYRSAALVLMLVIVLCHVVLWRRRREHIRG